MIEQQGDYENKLQFVTLKLDDKKVNRKQAKGPPSRICSGTTDPEVLKEQLLIKLFENIWPVVSQIVESLLTRYADHVINHSVQYSSISREPSTRGQIESPMKIGSEIIPNIGWRANRPLSATSRPSSTKYRLQEASKEKLGIRREELENVLQIKSLTIHGDRASSATYNRAQSSVVSLPTLSNHRPVSSKSSNHLLTPRLTNEQRPTSTSSHTRLRYLCYS